MRIASLIALVVLLATFSVRYAAPVAADGLALKSQGAQNQFPNGIQFQASFTSNVDVSSARLHFRILPEGPSTISRGQCNTGKAVDCTASIGGSGGAYIVPRSEVRYYWEATDAAGQTINTEEQSYTYQDTRFQWQNTSDGNITVYFYAGDQSTLQSIITAARQTIDRMSALEGTSIDFPVKILLYQSAKDAQPAFSSSRDPGRGITLGEVASADTAIVSREGFAIDTVRHEVAHIVTDHAVSGNQGFSIWVNEGLSMYAQNAVGQDEKSAFDFAVRTNRVYALSSLESVATRSNDPSIFYSQAHSLIKYLVEVQGADKLPKFLAALNKDSTDGALKTAYGFGTAELENKWRDSLGLPPVATGGGSNNNERPIPTIVPFGSGSSGSGSPASTPATNQPEANQQPASSDKGSSSLVLPLAIGAIVAVLAVGGVGVYARRRKSASPPAP